MGWFVKCPIARPVEERISPVPIFLVLPRMNVAIPLQRGRKRGGGHPSPF